jgi:hypothetical protein
MGMRDGACPRMRRSDFSPLRLAREREKALPVRHDDLLALTHIGKPRLFERTHGVERVDARDPGQGEIATSTARTSSPRRWSSTAARSSRIASLMFSIASASLAPRDLQRGKPGTETEKPSSDRCTEIRLRMEPARKARYSAASMTPDEDVPSARSRASHDARPEHPDVLLRHERCRYDAGRGRLRSNREAVGLRRSAFVSSCSYRVPEGASFRKDSCTASTLRLSRPCRRARLAGTGRVEPLAGAQPRKPTSRVVTCDHASTQGGGSGERAR